MGGYRTGPHPFSRWCFRAALLLLGLGLITLHEGDNHTGVGLMVGGGVAGVLALVTGGHQA